MRFYKYQGAGNDFLIADNRDGRITVSEGFLRGDGGVSLRIPDICDRRYGIGADGVMLLENSETADFKMSYFNSDGSGGMMCGNGGRCIVAFAADCGISSFEFEAADGMHSAMILDSAGCTKTVRLKMKDVAGLQHFPSLSGVNISSDGYFLDTGTRHFVRFVEPLDNYPVFSEGRDIRFNAKDLQPIGVNVNFVQPADGVIKVRTYEKGVEDETFACGTGIVASAIAAFVSGIEPCERSVSMVRYNVQAKRERLAVEFIPSITNTSFSDVWLTGPAVFIAEVNFR